MPQQFRLFPTFVLLLSVFGSPHVQSELSKSTAVAIPSGLETHWKWLRLGRWQNRGGQYVSEADGPDFFLAKDGKRNPREELEETVRRMLETPKLQCDFMARRRFLFTQLGIPRSQWQPCPERDEWKKRLNAKSASLIFASSYINNPASMFGHTFLKFHATAQKSDKDLLDYGVNFAATTGADGGVGFAVKGLVGLYRGHFSLQPYHETLRTYVSLEGRDVWEYHLSLTADEVDELIDHLLELERTWFDYYFFDENCSYHLLGLLSVVREELHPMSEFFAVVIPSDTIRVITSTPGLVTETRYRPSLMTKVKASADRLSLAEQLEARHLVRSKLPPTTEGLRVETFDAALDYGSVLAGDDPKSWEERNYQLRVARAKRSVASGDQATVAELTIPRRPEEAHGPARVGLWHSSSNARSSSGERSQRFGLEGRFAFHHLASSDDGLLANTSIEAMRGSVEWERTDSERFQRDRPIQLGEFVVLDLFSASESSILFQPISWRTMFGWTPRELPEGRILPFSAEGGVGYTLAFFRHRFYASVMAQTAILSDPALNRGMRWELGPQLMSWIHLPWHTKLLARWDWPMVSLIDDRATRRTEAYLGVALSKDGELRFGYREENAHTQMQVALFWHGRI